MKYREIILTSIIAFIIAILSGALGWPNQFAVVGIVYLISGYLAGENSLNKNIKPYIIIISPFIIVYGLTTLIFFQKHTFPIPVIAPLSLLMGFFIKNLWMKHHKGTAIASTISFGMILLLGKLLFMPNWILYSFNSNSSRNEPLPTFSMLTLDSLQYDNASFEGKVVVFDLWTTSCGVCFQKFPEFNNLYQEFSTNKDVKIFSVNLSTRVDTPEKIVETIESKIKIPGYKFPILLAQESYEYYSQAFGFQGVPNAIVIDKKGRVRYCGMTNNNNFIFVSNLETILKKLLKES